MDVTFVRPSDAFDVACDAPSFALAVAALAASDVVEALRTAKRAIWGLRRSARDAMNDIAAI